jgi:phospholipid transport system substrate-binding protein
MTPHALATLVFLVCVTAPAFADAPAQELQSRVDRAVQVMNDPAVKGPAHLVERRARVRKIADEIFDFTEMGKRALSVHWQELAHADRERFVRLFSDLLDRAYFEKIDAYNGEKVTYFTPRVDGSQATVPTRVVTEKGTDMPVEYRMRQEGGRWLVYDVVIDGVSLVSNYRAQFDRIIRTGSVNELLRRMEAQAARK